MKYLWTCLVGICTLGMMGCGEDSTGANQSDEIWVADLGEKGGMSNTWRLDFTKEPQLLAGQYAGGVMFAGILGTYEFNDDGLLMTTDACVDEYGQAPSEAQCEGLGELEQFPIYKTQTGYILVRTSYEIMDGETTVLNDTIPFKKQ